MSVSLPDAKPLPTGNHPAMLARAGQTRILITLNADSAAAGRERRMMRVRRLGSMVGVVGLTLFAAGTASAASGYRLTQRQGSTRIITTIGRSGARIVTTDRRCRRCGRAAVSTTTIDYRRGQVLALDPGPKTYARAGIASLLKRARGEQARLEHSVRIPELGVVARLPSATAKC